MQRQKDKPTIQESLESALNKLFGFDIKVNYAGRTDAGVHALAQTVDFYAYKFDEKIIKKALNAILCDEIRIIDAKLVSDSFHSRYSCIFRDYVYIIDTSEVCMPFLNKYVWHVPLLDVKKLLEIKSLFVGLHDFSQFSKRCVHQNTNRNILYIRVKQKAQFAIIFIRGRSFLRSMIRLIVGAMVAYTRGYISASSIKAELSDEKLTHNLIKASPSGLYFKRAIY